MIKLKIVCALDTKPVLDLRSDVHFVFSPLVCSLDVCFPAFCYI